MLIPTRLHDVTSDKTITLIYICWEFQLVFLETRNLQRFHTFWRLNPLKTEFLLTYKYLVRTSQETHYVSITKPNRLMLFREIIVVYCENHMEHINTLCGQNAEFTTSSLSYCPHQKGERAKPRKFLTKWDSFSLTEIKCLSLFIVLQSSNLKFCEITLCLGVQLPRNTFNVLPSFPSSYWLQYETEWSALAHYFPFIVYCPLREPRALTHLRRELARRSVWTVPCLQTKDWHER
jgi:hypothetical protein